MLSLASFQLTPPQDAREFEQLLSDYCPSIFPGKAYLFVRPGQKQYGVDVVSSSQNRIIVIQCKNYQDTNISTAMIEDWIQNVEEFIPKIAHFIIVISGKTDGEIQKYVLIENQNRQLNGMFSVEVLFWEEISSFLKANPQILQRYYSFINTSGNINKIGIAYRNVNDLQYDFVDLVLKHGVQDFLSENPFVGIKTDYVIWADQFDIAFHDLFQRAVLLQETEMYTKIAAFYDKWNEYHSYLATKKVQPSKDGQFVRMNQVLMKDDIYKAYKSIID